MNERHHLPFPPPHIRRRLVWDAVFLWLGVRAFALLFPGEGAASPLLPTARTSLVIIAAAVLLCHLQVRRFRERDLLRNLGVSLKAQLLLSASLIIGLELAARKLVRVLFPAGGPW